MCMCLLTRLLLLIACDTDTGISLLFFSPYFLYFLLLLHLPHISFCILHHNTGNIIWVGFGLCLLVINDCSKFFVFLNKVIGVCRNAPCWGKANEG